MDCVFYFAAAFQKQKEEIHLETCCITGNLVAYAHACIFVTSNPHHTDTYWSIVVLCFIDMNDVVTDGIHRPIIYGIGNVECSLT